MTDSIIQSITTGITSSLHSIFMLSSSRHYWWYMLCYLLIAIALYLFATAEKDKQSFLSFLFPKKIYTHPSLLLDFKIWLVVALTVKLGLFGLIYTGVHIISGLLDSTFDLLGSAWQANRTAETPGFMDRVWYTLILTCCIDFGFFIMHYCQHRISWLWAFHKVHHSAEVLTPVTANRHHPVDYTLEAATAILLGALGTVVFTRWHGTEVDRLTLLNTSAIHCVYYMTANLRHSHLWLHFGKLPCMIFVSPAMHQCHHSTAPKHYNKNFGFVLHNGEQGYTGLIESMFRPFKDAAGKIASTSLWARKSPFAGDAERKAL